MHAKQLEWLMANAYSHKDGRKLLRDKRKLLRDKSAFESMKACFASVLRGDTLTPMRLEQEKIATWLCEQVKVEKDARRCARSKEKGEAAGRKKVGALKAKRQKKEKAGESDSEEEEASGSGSSSEESTSKSGSESGRLDWTT